jgi:hypothetical protein
MTVQPCCMVNVAYLRALPQSPTADTTVLLSYASSLLGRLWEPGTAYHKAGVVLDGLEPPSTGQQLSLFSTPPTAAQPVNEREEKTSRASRPSLMASLDALNQRFGLGTVRLATALPALGEPAATAGRPGKVKRSGAPPLSRPDWKIYSWSTEHDRTKGKSS